MAKAFTLVFYIIPEDLDDIQIPNAFAIPKDKNDITLTDIEKYFPLEGKFQFRFQYKYSDSIVWLDLNNKKVKVPQFDEKIIMKVTRKVKKNLEGDKGDDVPKYFEYTEKQSHDSLLNL